MLTPFQNHETVLDLTEQADQLNTQWWQASAFSFVCFMCMLFTFAAATRVPAYLEQGDMARLVGVGLLAGLVLLCTADNIRTHLMLARQRKSLVLQPVAIDL